MQNEYPISGTERKEEEKQQPTKSWGPFSIVGVCAHKSDGPSLHNSLLSLSLSLSSLFLEALSTLLSLSLQGTELR